ncbi:FtsK/SpoIIIE domain-containing protein [Streptomyces kanamyceticus]|uniref:Cell division protein FtsK n=1 Tax=Streptomyces kanamyceticus TaxID=1967 RepID=A0A5J6GKA7_STRKN|nr:FtsK/SpoIIIE domain-containing protein [Streptomyces kanamyceticus]QEU94834.1 cell division protein FtsK [Streptomyces kanamyceticus]
MPGSLIVWILSALLTLGALTQSWWEPKLAARGVNTADWPWRWWLLGYPRVVLRMRLTWRQLTLLNNLSVSHRPTGRLLGDVVVQGQALRPRTPRLRIARPTRNGLTVTVLLHPGQTPAPYFAAAGAMEHAWRVYRVRVASPRRGFVQITVIALDPLTGARQQGRTDPSELMAADVGTLEDGPAWIINLRRVPHWLVTGATQSGKSSLLAALVRSLSRQRVALVGIDCKGGMELGLFGRRLTKLATDRPQALVLLLHLVEEIRERMALCRAEGVRSIWDLPETERPVPVVVIVDELAELYLTDGSREERDEAEQCGVLLLRLTQLGAALGLHLVVAGQRVGSDLGPRVTALRAQLGGRIAHRAHDEASAQMTLGDINPDAVIVAQTITEDEKGVAVYASGGQWVRARSHLVTASDVAAIATAPAPADPFLRDRPVPVAVQKGGTAP